MARQKHKWYAAGLHFECMGCGSCCAGPEEGYIWITPPEIRKLAAHLGETPEAVTEKYIKKIGNKYSIKEDPKTKDCIFLTSTDTGRGCAIYNVRPNQCRTWPFWNSNLDDPFYWNMAATTCGGINRGPFYTFEEIEKRRKQQKWWSDEQK